jgi:hypothetical protein
VIPYDLALAACDADIARRARTLWAVARRYQMQVDAFAAAGQPPPPPPSQLAGRVRVASNGTVEFLNPADAQLAAD